MIQIDESNDYKAGAEDEKSKKRQGYAVLHEEQKSQETVKSFDKRVAPGYRSMAGTAPGAKKQKADNRDVVIPAYPAAALRAGRRRGDNRLLFRQAIDADIEE